MRGDGRSRSRRLGLRSREEKYGKVADQLRSESRDDVSTDDLEDA